MPKIVMSYRRDDSQAATHYLFERLRQHFGQGTVFLDFDSIPYGVDFREHIRSVLHQCDVMLAMIGPRWQTGGSDRNRLGEDNDWVRYEVEQALASNIWLVPVLLDGAAMPRADQLPESIRKLTYLNAVLVDTGRSFDTDAATLVRALESGFPKSSTATVGEDNFKQRTVIVDAGVGEVGDNAPKAASVVRSSIALFVERRRWAIIGAALVVFGAALGLYFMRTAPASLSAGEQLIQLDRAPSQFRTPDEVAIGDAANKAASLALAEAATADKVRQDAVRAFQDSDSHAQQGVSVQLEWTWSDADKTVTNVRYRGDVADGPTRADGGSAVMPNGLGVAMWEMGRHNCVQGVNGDTPGQYYGGQFANGRINGVGIWRHCDGSSVFGHFTDNRIDGYTVVMTLDGAVFRGRKSADGAVGAKEYKFGGNVAKYAGQWNATDAFHGHGILTCADASQWKGHWSNNALQFSGLGYDAHGHLLPRKDFSKGPIPFAALCH
jgi:hypothetical protein